MSELTNVPASIAIIMDGNGRWAKKRFLPRTAGHAQGAKTVEDICEACDDLGVKCLTIYAFSTENWSRPDSEVKTLMDILRRYLITALERCMKNNMCVRVIGDISKLSKDLQDSITNLEEKTKDNTGLHFNIAINYGGRDEIIRAVKKTCSDVVDGKLSIDDINENVFSNYLDTAGLPYPDLMIRTSGELRTSNFLPWQLAYSEFYFTDVLWPDFNKKELIKAIEYYNNRDRRFGAVK